WHAAELEPHDHSSRGQVGYVDPAVHGPDQQHRIEVARRELLGGVTLAPLAEALHDLAELVPGLGQLILPTASGCERRALDHARVFQLVQTLRQEGARDQRHPAADLVESPGTGEQLAQDQRCPSLGEDLAGHGDRAELTIALHGLDCSQPPGQRQVHFLVLEGPGAQSIVLTKGGKPGHEPKPSRPIGPCGPTGWRWPRSWPRPSLPAPPATMPMTRSSPRTTPICVAAAFSPPRCPSSWVVAALRPPRCAKCCGRWRTAARPPPWRSPCTRTRCSSQPGAGVRNARPPSRSCAGSPPRSSSSRPAAARTG